MLRSPEDPHLDETLFALTSKLPTPPPRPASISSSRSSRRSSVASSVARQSRHFDQESNEPPPTPSLAEMYMNMSGSGASSGIQPPMPNTYSSSLRPSSSSNRQERETANSTASTSYSMAKSSSASGSNGAARSAKNPQQRVSPSSSFTSSSAVRRSSKRDGPTIVIGTNAVPSPQSTNTSLLTPPTVERTLSQSSHQSDSSNRPIRPVRRRPPHEGSKAASRASLSPSSLSTRTLRQASLFVWEVIRACVLLATLIVWPLTIGALRMLASSSTPSSSSVKSDGAEGGAKASEKEDDGEGYGQRSSDRTFAERFKFRVCSSLLLSNTLSISSYETATKTKPSASEEAVKTLVYDETPSSKADERMESTLISDDAVEAANLSVGSNMVLTRLGTTLLRSTALSALLLAPFASSVDSWSRSVLSVASFVFALVSVIGVRKCETLRFEVESTSDGAYRLSSFDEVLRTSLTSERMDVLQRERIKETMCERVATLIDESKRFDIECNRALSLIQETELVSRGYKLSHPLPPISRIEMSGTSPPRLRNGSLPPSRAVVQAQSPTFPSGSRLSWDQRPASLVGTPNANGAASIAGGAKNELRLLDLRKRLLEGFEMLQKDLQSAVDELQPLADREEMNLLREMYELDHLPASQSILPELTSINSSLQRGSWASRNMSASDTTRRSSTSPTVDEPPSSPGTPLNRGSMLIEGGSGLERYGSLRKRGSGAWDHAGTVRPSSRLSYISDKSPVNAINHNGALKRLSYTSNGSMSAVGSLSYRSSLQAAPRIVSQNRRQSGMYATSPVAAMAVEEERPLSPELSGSMTPNVLQYVTSESDGVKIAAIKNAFEAVHCLRRKALVSLLALDFSLHPEIAIKSSPVRSSAQYWHTVGKLLSKLSSSFGGRAHLIKQNVQRETTPHSSNETKQRTDSKTEAVVDETDYSGFEDRLMAMGQALRTVQIKMQLCASDLRKRAPPALHGGEDAENTSADASKDDKTTSFGIAEPDASQQQSPDVLFSTIREDLITLSAEWESALKIMRVNQLAQTATSSKTPPEIGGKASKSTFDSPQEADEDAMREWVRRHAGAGGAGDQSTDTDIDADIKAMIERGQAPWRSEDVRTNDVGKTATVNGPDESSDSDKKVEEDLSTLLISSTNPANLPAPGLEKVYEDVAVPHARLNRQSGLTREQRIKLVRESRVDSEAAKRISSMDLQNGMIVELQSVMHNRRSMLSGGADGGAAGATEANGASRPVLGTVNSNVDVKGRSSVDSLNPTTTVKPMPSEVNNLRTSTIKRSSLSRVPVRGSLGYRGRLSSPLELSNEAESALPYAR